MNYCNTTLKENPFQNVEPSTLTSAISELQSGVSECESHLQQVLTQIDNANVWSADCKATFVNALNEIGSTHLMNLKNNLTSAQTCVNQIQSYKTLYTETKDLKQSIELMTVQVESDREQLALTKASPEEPIYEISYDANLQRYVTNVVGYRLSSRQLGLIRELNAEINRLEREINSKCSSFTSNSASLASMESVINGYM